MSRMTDSLYFDWELYGDGWLDYDKTTMAAMKEFMECFVGQRLSSGQDRDVFSHKFDKTVVIKVQKAYGTQNAVEASTWKQWAEWRKVSRWLAPVIAQSSSNRVIIQRRTMPMLAAPETMPNFLSDFKVQNYGLIGKSVVCHDYGLGIFLRDPDGFKMEKTQWWDAGTKDDYKKLKDERRIKPKKEPS